MSRDVTKMKVKYWNVWWTLTLITGAATIIVAILEALGIFHDVGIALSVAGIVLSIIFGVTASTRSAVTSLGGQLIDVREGVSAVREELGAVREGVSAVGGEVSAVRGEVVALRDSVAPTLERILGVLTERLPQSPAR